MGLAFRQCPPPPQMHQARISLTSRLGREARAGWENRDRLIQPVNE